MRGRPRKVGAFSVAGCLAILAMLAAHGAQPALAVAVQQGDTRVGLEGTLSPKRLPRVGRAPITVSVAAKISGVGGAPPPVLHRIDLKINSEGVFDRSGLPVCTLEEIQPTTDADALAACASSRVGEGKFSAQVGFGGQAPFPAEGKILAFNGSYEGQPAILAHVFGTEPAPTSYTLPFVMRRRRGTYGTELSAVLPDVTGSSGYITGLSLELGRNFDDRGSRRSYISAGCPAPAGFPGATFPFVHAAFSFAGGKTLGSTITGNCRVQR